MLFRKGPALMQSPRRGGPSLGGPSLSMRVIEHRNQSAMLQKKGENRPHLSGFLLIDDQPSSVGCDVIAQHRNASHPFALASRRPHLVTRSFRNQFAFELGKREQDRKS